MRTIKQAQEKARTEFFERVEALKKSSGDVMEFGYRTNDRHGYIWTVTDWHNISKFIDEQIKDAITHERKHARSKEKAI